MSENGSHKNLFFALDILKIDFEPVLSALSVTLSSVVYGKRELLKFGVREENLVDPDYVVGVPNII